VPVGRSAAASRLAKAGRTEARKKGQKPSMPLRCLDPTGRSIQSFDLADKQWRALEIENRRARHLRMPCCSAQVTLKRSRLGTPFFAHKAVGMCTTAAETEAHLRLKRMAVEVARANGWTARTEKTGTSPSGAQWKADVFAQKGKSQVAVEIQWSSQTDEVLMRRQERYRESGVRSLWLLRQSGFPITRDLPAARIGGSLEEGFLALISSCSGHQAVPMRQFLSAVFGKRFRFGLQLGTDAIVAIRAGLLSCWSCGVDTRIITGIDVGFGPNELSFTIPDIEDHTELLESVLSRLPGGLEIGSIKPRFSKTQGRLYISNGCFHCDALIGEFYEHDAWDQQETVGAFSIRICKQWQEAIESHCGYEKTWGVYGLAGDTT
jgi:Competence protein CoiA-like family